MKKIIKCKVHFPIEFEFEISDEDDFEYTKSLIIEEARYHYKKSGLILSDPTSIECDGASVSIPVARGIGHHGDGRSNK